jgi:hypothetical protein
LGCDRIHGTELASLVRRLDATGTEPAIHARGEDDRETRAPLTACGVQTPICTAPT